MTESSKAAPSSDASEKELTRTRTRKWCKALKQLKPGMDFLDHIAHMDLIVSGHANECAVEQVCEQRSVLLAGLEHAHEAFNMPSKLPKYVCICNLSGSRRLFYSNEHQELITFLARSTNSNLHTETHVQRVLEHAAAHGYSVLLSYSLPFQAGWDRAHWELRTFSRDDKNVIVDGQLAYAVDRRSTAQVGRTKNSISCVPSKVLHAQVDAFRKHISAVDMDCAEHDDDGRIDWQDREREEVSPYVDEEDAQDRLKAKVALLCVLRKRTETMHREECERLKRGFEERYKKAQSLQEELNEREKSTQKQLATQKAAIENITTRHTEVVKALTNMREDAKWERETHERRISADKSKDVEIKALKRRHADFERQKAQWKSERAAMEADFEQRQKLSAQSERAAMEADFEQRQKLAARSHSDAIQEMQEKIRHGTYVAERLGLVVDSLSNEKKTLEDALQKVEGNRKTLLMRLFASELRSKCGALQKTRTRTGKTCDAGTDCGGLPSRREVVLVDKAMLTDILPETLRIGELEQQLLSLRDKEQQVSQEKNAPSSEDTPSQSGAAYHPLGINLAHMPSNVQPCVESYANPPFHSPCDPGTEHMILQLHNAVQGVCDLARGFAVMRMTANDAACQLRTLQQALLPVQGAPHGGIQQQQQQQQQQQLLLLQQQQQHKRTSHHHNPQHPNNSQRYARNK
jgi:hypothetical protein